MSLSAFPVHHRTPSTWPMPSRTSTCGSAWLRSHHLVVVPLERRAVRFLAAATSSRSARRELDASPLTTLTRAEACLSCSVGGTKGQLEAGEPN